MATPARAAVSVELDHGSQILGPDEETIPADLGHDEETIPTDLDVGPDDNMVVSVEYMICSLPWKL